MTDSRLTERLDDLKEEYRLGDARLRDLTPTGGGTGETLRRISGAIQVLEELIGADSAIDGQASTEADTLAVP